MSSSKPDDENSPSEAPKEPATRKPRAAAPRIPARGKKQASTGPASVAASKSKPSAGRARVQADEENENKERTAAEEDGDPEESDKDDEEALVGEVATDDDPAINAREPAIERGDKGLAKSDPFTAYFSEVQRHPLLKPEEEHSLAVKYAESQDVQAAAKLVTSNLRLVIKIAYEYRRAYRNIMDLIQEGNIGLMQAVKRYDPYRGVKLSSYAAWWIRAYILRFILNNWRLVKLGTTQAQRKLFFNLNKERQKLLALGIDPTPEALAKRLDVQESEVSEMDRRLSGSDVSLDAPVGDSDGRPLSRIDMLPSGDGRADDELSGLELGSMLREKLDAFAKTLHGKEATIFAKRLLAEDPVTLQEIGDEYGISRERVRQLEKRLTDKLRAYLKTELGEAIQFG